MHWHSDRTLDGGRSPWRRVISVMILTFEGLSVRTFGTMPGIIPGGLPGIGSTVEVAMVLPVTLAMSQAPAALLPLFLWLRRRACCRCLRSAASKSGQRRDDMSAVFPIAVRSGLKAGLPVIGAFAHVPAGLTGIGRSVLIKLARSMPSIRAPATHWKSWIADLHIAVSELVASDERVEARVATETSFLARSGNAAGYSRLQTARACHDAWDKPTGITTPTLDFAGNRSVLPVLIRCPRSSKTGPEDSRQYMSPQETGPWIMG